MQENIEPIKPTYKPSRWEIYGFTGLFRLVLSFIRTKLFYPEARLISFPIIIRGVKHINLGRGLTTGVGCRIEAYPYLNQGTIIKFGNNIEINDYVHITGIQQVIIGNNVLMASKIYISDSNHGSYSGDGFDSHPDLIPGKRKIFAKPVEICDNVWIGESVSVLAGVTIGRGSIIGSNSVVSRNIPAHTIAVGAPAKPIKRFDFEKQRWLKIEDKI